MSEEPRYVDDPFEEFDGVRPKWQIPPADDWLLAMAMHACNRKYFQSRDERKAWKTIRQAVTARQVSERWVVNCCEFASQRQRMPFANLLKYIGNNDKRQDWEARQKPEEKTDTPETHHGRAVSLVEERDLRKRFGDNIVIVNGQVYARSKIKGFSASGKPICRE